MFIVDGKVTTFDEKRQILTVTADIYDIQRFIRCNPKEARVGLVDSRTMSHEQRKKVYALLSEIADWQGELPELLKKQMKLDFRLKRLNGMAEDFSLSDAPMELVTDFIDFLVQFVIEWNVPTQKPLYELCDDIIKYEWHCLKAKRCAVCGKKAQLHHVDAVGMSRNRNKIDHIGMRCLPLCATHHMEIHELGDGRFCDKYHLDASIKINEEIVKLYKLGGKKEESYL